MNQTKIGVLGAGTWGTALARLLAVNGCDVTMWSALPSELDNLAATHAHPNLPGMTLPKEMHFTADMKELCAGKDVLLFAVPSVFVRSTAKKAAPCARDGQLIVDVAKGVEEKTLMTMSEIIEEEFAAAGRKNCRVVALSGPTHAEEVARDLPTLIVAGSKDEEAARRVQQVFTTPTFRVYTNSDRRGVELGGAVKNVIALAVGIAMGLGYGDNAKAALITRGNTELARLGAAMGCQAETFAGLSGMGDLIVTCTSMHSRNLHAGILIGQGADVETAKREVGQVVEGINALPAACKLAQKYNVEMPIVESVEEILSGRLAASDALAALMGRELKPE
ncbi:MAG: NAD(P)-dependent glycerol-3-phosphate dehydrogenase [Oscillospiraceae bacterium]|nr:NAD(P)-dependent glycerol-3-phosphate dehydrogenase [Oscillospiraceae bacterium]